MVTCDQPADFVWVLKITFPRARHCFCHCCRNCCFWSLSHESATMPAGCIYDLNGVRCLHKLRSAQLLQTHWSGLGAQVVWCCESNLVSANERIWACCSCRTCKAAWPYLYLNGLINIYRKGVDPKHEVDWSSWVVTSWVVTTVDATANFNSARLSVCASLRSLSVRCGTWWSFNPRECPNIPGWSLRFSGR